MAVEVGVCRVGSADDLENERAVAVVYKIPFTGVLFPPPPTSKKIRTCPAVEHGRLGAQVGVLLSVKVLAARGALVGLEHIVVLE